MSWVRLKNPLANTDIIDVDELSESVKTMADESEYLNEHNWDSTGTSASGSVVDALNLAEKVADDVALRLYLDVYGGELTGRDPLSSSGLDLSTNAGWEVVSDTNLRKTINTRGGMFLIILNFQCVLEFPSTNTFQFCIGINNTPRMESIIGSADGNNPRPSPATRYRYEGLLDSASRNASAPVDVPTALPDFGGVGPYIGAGNVPLQCTLLTYLPPGRHDIDLMSRHVGRSVSSGTLSTGPFERFISQGTIIAVEAWADPE